MTFLNSFQFVSMAVTGSQEELFYNSREKNEQTNKETNNNKQTNNKQINKKQQQKNTLYLFQQCNILLLVC